MHYVTLYKFTRGKSIQFGDTNLIILVDFFIIIRIVKLTGMAAIPMTKGLTIFIKATFSQISLGKIS